MNVQTLNKPNLTCSLSPNFRLECLPRVPAIQVSPQEFGYEIDEAELEIELGAISQKLVAHCEPRKMQESRLLRQIPSRNEFISNKDQGNQDVQPQEFEACFTWFLS